MGGLHVLLRGGGGELEPITTHRIFYSCGCVVSITPAVTPGWCAFWHGTADRVVLRDGSFAPLCGVESFSWLGCRDAQTVDVCRLGGGGEVGTSLVIGHGAVPACRHVQS